MMMMMMISYDQLHFLRYGSSLLYFLQHVPPNITKKLHRFFIDSPNLWNPHLDDATSLRTRDTRLASHHHWRPRPWPIWPKFVGCWLVFSFRKRSQNFGICHIYIYISISQNFWVDTKIHIIEKKGLSWKIQVFQARHTSLSTYPMMFEDFTTSRMKMCRKWWISIQPMLNFLSNFGKGALTENAEEFPPLFGVGLASWTRWVYTWHLSYENKTRFFHSGWVSIGLYHHWK